MTHENGRAQRTTVRLKTPHIAKRDQPRHRNPRIDYREKRLVPATLEEKTRLTLLSLIVQIRRGVRGSKCISDALEFTKPPHETRIVLIKEAEMWD